MVKKETTISFSSDTLNGALNRSADGSRFSVQLDYGSFIPSKAVYATAEVIGARVWNVSPNVSAAKGNNTFTIISTDPLFTTLSIVIPNGLYGVGELGALISREVSNAGYDSDLIMLDSDDSTNKVIITIKYAGYQVDFTAANSPTSILGFDARLIPLAPSAADGLSFTGDHIAAFNQINAYQIRSDLVGLGIQTNARSNGVICNIPISSKAGSQIIYNPFNPSRFNCDELIGFTKNVLTFELTSETGISADTNGESYAFDLVFRWVE